MIVDSYEVNEESVTGWARENGVKRVLVQAPDGLKMVAAAVAEILEAAGVEALISASHAWGGCDVALDEAAAVGADGVVHIGHHGPVWFRPPGRPSVLFVPARSTVDPTPVFSAALEDVARGGARTVAVLATVQHVHWLPKLKELAAERGLSPVTGSLAGVEGLVVGCDYSSLRRADAVLVVAGGLFHALGAAVASGAPTWAVDPYTRTYTRVNTEPLLSRRLYALSKAVDARSFAVVVSTKPGQQRLSLALRIRKTLEGGGRKAAVVVFNELTREALENLPRYEAYVNTACPRLAIDDAEMFPAPVLNPGELKYVLSGSLEGYSLRDALFLDLRFLGGP